MNFSLSAMWLVATASLAFAVPAHASSCTSTSTECSADLNIISASNIGSGSQGTVTLTELTSDSVLVEVSLTSGVKLINTSNGNSHTPFVFNLSASLTGVTVAIDTTPPHQSSTTPAAFDVLTGSQPETPYGTFTNGIGYTGQNGGGHGNAGPLYFTVTDTNGINLTNFVANGDGDFFGADVLGTNGNTGGIAADSLSCVASPTNCLGGGGQGTTPLPAALPLFVSGLGALGLLGWRRKQKAKVVVA